MEYYLYISESKVDMLFPQIPEETKGKLGAEVGVNVGVLKATLKTERESKPKENLIARLQAVVHHLKQSQDPGSVDQPKSWIEDTQIARIILPAEYNRVVFFFGTSPKGSRFALGGSAENLLPHHKPETVEIGWSFLPHLLDSLRVMVAVSDEKSLSEQTSTRVNKAAAASQEFEWMDYLKALEQKSLGTEMRIKVMAKELLSGKHAFDGHSGVLATPLYVSMA